MPQSPTLFDDDSLLSIKLEHWQPDQWPTDASWQSTVLPFLASPQGVQLAEFITQRLNQGAIIYPPQPFRALALTPLNQVRVVILGQDPYHGVHQAEGLAFSVALGVKIPPSLRNIMREIQRDMGLPSRTSSPPNGSLVRWAKQGVLLLNTCLTVEDGQPASHAKKGWESLTDALIEKIAASCPFCVFLLWGGQAQTKMALIETTAMLHQRAALVLTANHPSPLSAFREPAPFMGCSHFSVTNRWLVAMGLAPISW